MLFNKYGEDKETISGKVLPITLSNTHNLTYSELDDINFQWILRKTIQSVDMKESGWNV